MARIRIVDEWLRSPVSAPTRARAIMVVSSSWSEQRVLMRAYKGSLDQTRPTIVLHGTELAIGPAGSDPHSEWGIHVEPPIDGRAQQLREQLELAAKRLAGSKGNPPRLLDEVPSFESKATNLWAPGTPRATPHVEKRRASVYEPSESMVAGRAAAPASVPAATPASVPAATPVPPTATPESRTMMSDARAVPFSAPAASHRANKGGGFRSTPAPIHRSELAALESAPAKHHARSGGARSGASAPVSSGATPSSSSSSRLPAAQMRSGRSTVLGFESGAGTLGTSRPRKPRAKKKSLAHLVGHTMPLGFNLDDAERTVLNALGRAVTLSASEIGEIAGVGNGIAWMETLMGKLSDHGLDLIEPGEDRDGEPTYALRR